MELQLTFNPYCFSSIACETLLLPLILYLLLLPRKSLATWQLIGFFASLFVSLAVTFFVHALPYWWADIFWPFQDALVMFSGIFLIRFAYLFPHDDLPHERKFFSRIYVVLSVGAFAYSTYYAYQIFTHATPSEALSLFFLLLMPFFLLVACIILWRRSLYYAALPALAQIGGPAYRRSFVKAIFHPPTPYARAFRNLALAILFGLLPSLGSVFVSSEIYRVYSIAIGTIFTVAALALAYFNHSTESISFLAKLVGIPLVVFVSVFGIVGVEDLVSSRQLYISQIQIAGQFAQKSVMAENFAELPTSILYAVSKSLRGGTSAYTPLFLRTDEKLWLQGFPYGQVFQDSQALQRWLVWNMADVAEDLSKNERRLAERYVAYRFPHKGHFYEVGLSLAEYYQAGHARTVKRILQLFLGSLLVVGLFPLFFYMNLVRPLKNLLSYKTSASGGGPTEV